MKIKKYILFSIYILSQAGLFYSLPAYAKDTPRQTINLNSEWRYIRGNCQGAEQPSFNDQNWETIGLPHSFSIPYFMSKDFYTGYGWYRKSFSSTEEDLKQRVFLEFDGVFQEAEIYVNGKQAGAHIGGYTGFSVDISSTLQKGNNLIAIRVNNLWHPHVAPRAGEHVFSGGIYRNVRLVKKSPTYIDWYGTQVTTPDLGANKGKVSVAQVTTDVCNHSDTTSRYKLLTEITDAQGNIVASIESASTIRAHTTHVFEQTTTPIQNPALWSVEHPHLYKVISSLYQGSMLIDRDETSFGFRWIEWTADQGFFLNGEHCSLKGVNVHQDQAGWGDAITEKAMKRDVCQMKEAGFNFIRGSHYPHAPAFSHSCDEEGMLFWSEAPFWGIGGFKADGYWDSSAYPVEEKDRAGFEESALHQLAEMIRIHRNHPSIIAWSMCNEPFFSVPEAMPGIRDLLQKMVTITHQLDPTRPAAVGGVQRPLGDERIDKIGDIAGYNGDGGSIADFQNPGIPSIVSEYGSTTADRPGEYSPGWGDLQANEAWKGQSWRSGQAIWCGFDHGSIAGSQLGKMGIVDYFRIPKRAWYWYRNEYTGKASPTWATEGTAAEIKVTTSSDAKNVSADGTDDVMLTVSILDKQGKELTNSPSVTLKLVSGPGEFPTGTSITFDKESDIRIIDGKASIAFRSYHSGTAIIEATSPGLKSDRIKVTFTNAPTYKPGETPVAVERPYTRFTKTELTEETVQTFGRNNPTFASSAAIGHSAGYATDGNEQTWWQPEANDEQMYWTLDTEKGLALRHLKIVFPTNQPYQYVIETSGDNKLWNVLVDNKENRKSLKSEEIALQGKEKVRFVRIRFYKNSDVKASSIAEVEVKGVVLE